MKIHKKGYDRTNAVFSPEGRLHQIEYARICPEGGPLTVGIKYVDGIVLMRKSGRPDNIGPNPKMAFEIGDNMAFFATGQIIDAYTVYDNIIDSDCKTTEEVLKTIRTLYVQRVTDRNLRPLATILLLGSVDNKRPELFTFDVSGAQSSVNAWAIGYGSERAKAFLRKKYHNGMKIREGEKVAFDALKRPGHYLKKNLIL